MLLCCDPTCAGHRRPRGVPHHRDFSKRFGRLRYAARPMLIVDLLAFLPFYLPLMQRLVTYLATAVEPPRNLSTGQTIVAHLPPGVGTAT